MTTGIRKPGDFCWMNMLTKNPDAARVFFSDLLDWTYDEMPGVGHVVLVKGQRVGGIFDVEGQGVPAGTRPHIGVMVKVDSADDTAARVRTLAGSAKPSFDVADQGRMAVCNDPNGAEFDIWQPKNLKGMEADSRAHGAPSWFETLTSDVKRATTFYCETFGWTAAARTMDGTAYTTFSLDDAPVAGLMGMSAAGKSPDELKPHWATYFTVHDAAATLAKATHLGASITIPVTPIPGEGRFGGVVSPQGVQFYVIQYAG